MQCLQWETTVSHDAWVLVKTSEEQDEYIDLLVELSYALIFLDTFVFYLRAIKVLYFYVFFYAKHFWYSCVFSKQ